MPSPTRRPRVSTLAVGISVALLLGFLITLMVVLRCRFKAFRVAQWRPLWPPVIFSLTTVPWRMSTLPRVVDNLFEAVPDATIVLNIPHQLTRKKMAYPPLPAELVHHAKAGQIIIQRPQDIGPMTKSLPTLQLHNTLRARFGESAVILVVDDDILYNADFLHSLLSFWASLGSSRFSTVVSNSNTSYMRWQAPFPMVEGFAGILIPLAVCSDKLVATLAAAAKTSSPASSAGCLTCDDLVISWALHRNNIRVTVNSWIDNAVAEVWSSEMYDGDSGGLKQQGHGNAYAQCLVGLDAMASSS